MGQQTQCPFDGKMDKDLDPLELVSFDLWGLSCVQSGRGKMYLMAVVNAGTSHKYGAYLRDQSDTTTIEAFDTFQTQAETITGKKIH